MNVGRKKGHLAYDSNCCLHVLVFDCWRLCGQASHHIAGKRCPRTHLNLCFEQPRTRPGVAGTQQTVVAVGKKKGVRLGVMRMQRLRFALRIKCYAFFDITPQNL